MAIACRVALLMIVALLSPTELRAKSDKPALQATAGTVSGEVQKVGLF